MNQIELIKLGGVATLIKELTESREEELSCAVKYVLHACIKTDRKHSILNQYGALKASAKYQECDYSVSHFNMETDCGQCDHSRGNHIKSLSPVNEYKVLSLYNMEVTKKLDKLQSLLEDHLFMAKMPYSSETSVKANNVQHDIRSVSLTVNSQKNVTLKEKTVLNKLEDNLYITRPSSSMVCDASKWPTERSSCSLHGGGNTRDQYERNLTRSVSCMLGKQHDEQITGSSGRVQLIQLTPKSYTRRTEIHNRCLDQSWNECNCCKANDNCLAHRHEKDDLQTNDKQVDIRRQKYNKPSRLLDDHRYGQVQVEDASPQDNHSYHNLSASNRLSVCHHCCELTRNELDIDVITRSSKLRKKTACLGHVDVHSSVLDNQARNSEESSDVKCPKDPFVKPFQPPLSRLNRTVESLEADNMSVYESEFDSHVLQNAKLNSLRQNISSDVDSKQQTGNNGSNRKPNDHLSSSKGYPDLGRVNKSGKNVFVQRCPGCQTPAECQLPVLNSRNYSIAIETSCYTCSYHRLLREQERIFISGVKKRLPQHRKCSVVWSLPRQPTVTNNNKCHSKERIYEFDHESEHESSLENNLITFPGQQVTPPCALDTGTTPMNNMISSYHSKRRPRVPYTNEEVEALLKGVATRGRKWSSILHSFKFHPSRTAVDLKDKYKRLIMTKSPGRQTSKTEVKKPFSMAEVRRLKRGVRLFGYSWKTVLSCMQFSRGRTARELREKWRTLNRTRLV